MKEIMRSMKKEKWEKIFKLGDKISLQMAIDQNINKQTKSSTRWVALSY